MVFYTDGSCLANGKADAAGGYGIVGVNLATDKVEFVRAKRSYGTTNNREELKAILYVMLNYGEKCDDWGQPPIVYSDSAYCVNTFNEWMFGWARKGWIKSDKKVPENLDLIQSLYKYLIKDFWNCQVMKVKGHSNIMNNELADALSTNNINKFNKIINENDIKDIELENL